MPKYAAKRDTNERPIIEALEAIGCTVFQLNHKDIPDLLVGKHGRNILIEVKDKHGKLSEGQREWHLHWQGQCAVARSVEEALAIVMREKN